MPFPPDGASGLVARSIADKLSASVLVENRSGAGGGIATGTPADVLALLNVEINRAVQAADVKEKFAALGALTAGTSMEMALARFRADTAK